MRRLGVPGARASLSLLVLVGVAGFGAPAGRSQPSAFQPSLYLGSWTSGPDSSEIHWLLLAINKETQGVAYDPPRGRALCQLSVRGDSVAFTTAEMAESSEGYQLAFRGVLTDSGMTGTVVVYTARSDPEVLRARFRRVPLQAAGVAPDTETEGLYATVNRLPETGGLNGNELLVLRTRKGVMALYTVYADGPFGPSLADSVRIHGDTADIVTTIWGPTAPFSRTFILSRHAEPPPTQPVPVDRTKPIVLRRVTSVAQLFGPEQTAPCLPPEPNGRTGW